MAAWLSALLGRQRLHTEVGGNVGNETGEDSAGSQGEATGEVSQRKSYNWEEYDLLLKRYPLPRPKIYVNLYALMVRT